MKKYPIINRNFNRTPQKYALICLVLCTIIAVWTLFSNLFDRDASVITKIISIAWSFVWVWLCYYLYMGQFNLVNARIGKHLKKYHKVKDEELIKMLESIEHEMQIPIYVDEMDEKGYNTFFVTQNWLVGTDGIVLLRANACKRADIVEMAPHVIRRYQKGVTYEYHVLRVKDKHNYTYDFWMEDPDKAYEAYDYLRSLQNKE